LYGGDPSGFLRSKTQLSFFTIATTKIVVFIIYFNKSSIKTPNALAIFAITSIEEVITPLSIFPQESLFNLYQRDSIFFCPEKIF